MARTDDLKKAKEDKNDEFYTMLEDVQAEMNYYEDKFKGKTIFCNCDDPYESNFFKYFAMNFNRLGLKKLISTCYWSSPILGTQLSLLDDYGEEVVVNNREKRAYKVELTNVPDVNGDGVINIDDVELLLRKKGVVKKLKGDGDFRSQECIELLKEADICVTNPPFSLFREYISLLMKYNKKFLIIGNQNAITYKEFFPLIKENKVWMGASIHSGDREFRVPDSYPLNAAGCRVDEKGHKYIRVKGVRWWTNLDYPQRHEYLALNTMDQNRRLLKGKKEEATTYKKYDNYDAINIDASKYVPRDYDGVMGVPITFLDKYNPDQFEIVGLGIANLGLECGVQPYKPHHRKYRKEIQKRGTVDGDLYMVDKDDHPIVPYARVLIKRKR